MLYIGNFLYLTNQQEQAEDKRRHGEFNLIVEADSDDKAIELCRERISGLRQSSDFFEGSCRVFFNQLIEFERAPNATAALVNFKSIAGDPQMPFIGCTLPSEEADDCRIFDWDGSHPEIDGEKDHPFMTF